ncbi:glycosyltransferase family 2 protein [Carboxylicivirga sp. A043]|uniref:glycosyltransferase family 2 protein n=1 Tax=Carboxylicivirga litoralis TaxID=2816963 RepID=UPI0021CB298C|nr:glycosyltransferase family 2 protein [Carboxylicivirga sp. A043]MCU4157231.1 glycosyltransferase family 2 protein [Carboxylicivirga sp. A043]
MNKVTFDLSIIIVSYNAVDFLKLTLESVEKAISNVNAEVLLIDNSNDNTLRRIVANNYPFVRLIENEENLGFAKGNNLALKQAKGKLALLLNPDTIVPEDAFIKIINYYSEYPETGGLGFKMIDGNGQFLLESKRGFPSPSASFFKLFRFHKFFPNSETIAKYYEGHLDNNTEQSVDVLSGACLVIPRTKNNDLTCLDERYFMYGEDIDLSYRLKLEHGNNIYLPQITIIHFKGQSTQTTPKIIWHFYNAMWLFYKTHIKANKSFFATSFIRLGIILLTQYKIFLTKFDRSKSGSARLPYFSSVQLISKDNKYIKMIEQQLKSTITVTHQHKQSSKNQLTIFDFNYITYKQAIELMSGNDGSYGFLTKNQKSLIICQNPSEKGIVIHL